MVLVLGGACAVLCLNVAGLLREKLAVVPAARHGERRGQRAEEKGAGAAEQRRREGERERERGRRRERKKEKGEWGN